MRILALLLLLAWPPVAAAGDKEEGFKEPPKEWATVEIAPFNAKAEAAAGAAWTRSPLHLALGLFGDDADARLLQCEVRRAGGEGGTTTVVLIRDGLLDDSLRGSWIELECRRLDDGTWRLAGARSAQRCWRAKDPTKWMAVPCP